MPLSKNTADAVGCLLWLPGLVLGACGGVFLLVSGVIPSAVIDTVPILGLGIIFLGACLGAVGAGAVAMVLQGDSAGKEAERPKSESE